MEVFSGLLKWEIRKLLMCYFLLSTFIAVSSRFSCRINSFTSHGKLNFGAPSISDKKKTRVGILLDRISIFKVSKNLFSSFYLIGTVMTVCCIYTGSHNCRTIAFLIHLLRRYFEEKVICIHSTDCSEMNVLVYLYGLSYYIVMPITIQSVPEIQKNTVVYQLFSFSIFSILQTKSHLTLSNIRRKNKELKYGVPFGGLFKYISSPHYFCEIGIYLSLFLDLLTNFKHAHIITSCMYIVSCMFVNALRTHEWYLEHFKDSYSTLKRKVIVPFLF